MSVLDLQFITPPQVTLSIDGEEVIVTPIRMRNLQPLVKAVEPVFGRLMALAESPSVEAALHLTGEHADAVSHIVALCTGLKLQQVEQMLPDRVAALLMVCCEVNWDFFARAVPAIREQSSRLAPLLMAKVAGLGAGPSGTPAGQTQSTT